MFIDVYPSQDNNNQTLWIFSGSSTTRSSNNIRAASGGTTYHFQDSWDWINSSSTNSGQMFIANSPSNVNFSLSPLFSSSNTDDIASVRARIPGGGRTNITFAASATNTPTITIGSGSRTISHLFMDDDNNSSDDLGIRVSGSALSYSSGDSSAWAGSGLIDKPISDFFAGTFRSDTPSARFAANSQSSMRLTFNSAVIPEPEEYALVFGLFALGFVLFRHRRQMQKKKQRQAVKSAVWQKPPFSQNLPGTPAFF